MTGERDNHSRALPGKDFKQEHISRKLADLPPSVAGKIDKLNNNNGTTYRINIQKESQHYISLSTTSGNDSEFTNTMSGISEQLNIKLKEIAVTDVTQNKISPDVIDKRPTSDNYMLMLSYAIQGACRDTFSITKRNKSDEITETIIVEALKKLITLPLLGSVIDPTLVVNTGDDATNLAWRIAYKMAETSTGFDLLKKINTHDKNSDYTNPPVLNNPATAAEKAAAAALKRRNLRRDEHVRLFMQGAEKLLKEEAPGVRLKTDPRSLLAYCTDDARTQENRNNTLLVNALPALEAALLKNEIGSIPQHVANRKMWAANALRNGFFSNAPGSQFQKANARLEKVSLQVTRGLRNRNIIESQDLKNHDGLRRVAETSSLWWHKLKRNGGKTPFNGNFPIQMSTNGSLLQREKMTMVLRLLDKAFRTSLPEEYLDKASNAPVFTGGRFLDGELEDITPNLKKIATIMYVRAWASVSQAEVLDGRPLADDIIKKLTEPDYLHKLLGLEFGNAGVPKKITDCLEVIKLKFSALAAAPLTPGVLEGLFKKVEVNNPEQTPPPEIAFKQIPTKADIDRMQPDQYQEVFEKAMNLLQNGEEEEADRVTLDPNVSRQGIGNYLDQQAQRMRLGSSIKFSDGDSIGFGVQNTVAILGRTIFGFVAGIRFNLSHRRSRVATAEFGVNAAGGFARFGTETNRTNRIGFGRSLGWSLAKNKTLSAGISVNADSKLFYDPDKFTGVTLRMDRLGQDVTGRDGQIAGVAGDADMTERLGKAINKVINGPDGGPQESDLLSQLLEELPELSVSWLDEGASTKRDMGHIEQVGAVLGAYAGNIGLGVSASLAWTKKYQKQRYQEETGALQSRVIGSATRSTVNGQLGAAVLGTLPLSAGQPTAVSENAGIADVMGADAEIYRNGTREEIRTIELHGELQPRTYKLIIHANAEAFAGKVEGNIQEWGQRFAEIKDPDNYFHQDVDDTTKLERRMNATIEQAGVVRDLILNVHENAHSNTEYIEYLELAEATTVEINRYRHLAKMAELSGPTGKEEQEFLIEAAESLLRNPDSYVPRFLFTIETKVADEGHAITLVGSYSTTEKVHETVMLNGYAG
ncbi:hypothetical protein QN362_01460 [Actimicrobium sp. CCC2.4]|uniref:hypothetical protein n=1 Tax=Actimicrobium sp. CCC2.4 TaxID=3048606 RepID=UPI002AC8F287|nr:hypothetical protein [Actimicrobium sp. CCC2.4]MEB0133990.1 hypothetical protein [Actimicrobium sp. CCC2.4]WPX31526.1 hypothetical protein RHM62_14940 [Actimicrobium sp. CCC2.4]